jgi:glutamine synthetase
MNETTDRPWVQLTFVDVFGAPCSMLLPSNRWDEAVDRGVPFDGSALEGRARLAEVDMVLRPEPSTLVPITEDRSRVVCNVVTGDGEPWPGDPRATLLGLDPGEPESTKDLTFGAELEFYLLDEHGEPADRGGYFDDVDAAGMRATQDAATELRSLGVEISGCHHEAGDGQYEIDLAPMSAVSLADALVLAKHVVRSRAADAGLTATFMARPLLDQPGSGLHVHQRSSDLIDSSGKLTDKGRSFVAGQLAHADALCALAAPNVNSYRRLHAGAEAPSAAVWGHRNRGALVRISAGVEDASIEHRGADPGANPYLFVAGLIIAGRDGIDRDLELDAANDELPGSFDPGGAVRFDPLPRNLDEALDALGSDDTLIDALDPVLVDILTTGRRAELEEYRASVTGWELDRYLREA